MNYPTYTTSQVTAIFGAIPTSTMKKMKLSFSQQRSAAKFGRRAPMELTFEQWAAIWWDSGKWELRGNSKDKPYQMCRKDDLGSYSMGNVRIDTYLSNHVDAAPAQAKRFAALWCDPLFREKNKNASNARWESPEFRAMFAEKNREAHRRPIQGINKKTGEVKQWASILEAGKSLGHSPGNISNAASGKVKSAAGYFWSYL